MNPYIAPRYVLISVVSIFLFTYCGAQTQDDSAIVKDFQARVDKYMGLREKQHLLRQKRDVAGKIDDAHLTAHQGDIFTPAIAEYFKKQIETTMRGSAGEKIRTSLRHAEPLTTVGLKANTKYPNNLPLQSTPPTLLLNLPLLPKALQYRIVGSTLLLYDVHSDLIVDLIPDAIATA